MSPASSPPDHNSSLLERLLTLQSEAWHRGQRLLVEELLADHPALANDPETLLDLLGNEKVLRSAAGEMPLLEEYQQRFPHLAEELRIHFEAEVSDGVQTSPPIPPPTMVPLPEIAGYQILGELGRGGMGVVYRARQITADRIVAFKMILGVFADEKTRERFRIEAHAAAALQHPNIVQVFEVGESAGASFFSLEFCGGGSLDERLRRSALPPAEAAQLVKTLAEAMHHAHEHGIIHRDLKPANVLLTTDGTPKIADFGLAKKLDAGPGRTQTGAVMGSPSYMAPEQALGLVKAIGPATDVYALGAILYECLTGRPPFKAATALETLHQVVAEAPVPPRQLQPRTPRDLDTICLKCLQKDPRRRYASARALAEDLGRFQRQEPIAARPVGRLERAWRWCRRHPARVAAAVAICAGIALVIGGIFLQSLRKERDRAEQFREQAERLSALLTFQHGRALCEAGDGGRGVLWMARALAQCPESADELREQIRLALPSELATLHHLEAVYAFPPSENPQPHDSNTQQTMEASFSPDGKEILILSGEGIALIDRATGKPALVLRDYPRGVISAAFTPDGQTLVTASQEGELRIRDAKTGKDLLPAIHHGGLVRWIAISPEGRHVLVGGRFSGDRLAAYDVQMGTRAQTFPECKDDLYEVDYSWDGKYVVSSAKQNNAAIWDRKTGKMVGKPLVHPGPVFTASFSPDGKTLATGCLDGVVRFWDVAKGTELPLVLHHHGPVRGTVYSRDGRRLLTSSEDGTVRLWEVATGRAIGQPLVHPGELRKARLSPDETRILTAGKERTSRLWLVARPDALGKVLPLSAPVTAAAFSPDGRLALTGSSTETADANGARLWSVSGGEPVGPPLQRGQVITVAFSPDGQLAVTAGGDRKLHLWRTADGSLVREWTYGRDVAAAAFSPDGRLLAVGGQSARIQLLDVQTGKQPAEWQAYLPRDLWVWSLTFTPDGKRLLSGGGLAGKLWSVPDGQPIGQSMQHDVETRTVILSPDGRTVLTCGFDKTARLWSAVDGQPLSPPLRHGGQVLAGAFRPDGEAVATASADGTVRLWSVPNGDSLTPPLLHDGWVRSVAFHPDGQALVSGCDDGTAQLWNAQTGAALGAVLRHRGPVNRVVYHPDGKTILTASSDGTARLWTPPPPLEGDAASLRQWVEVLTGMELDDTGTVHVLPGEVWEARRRRGN